jgi:hypothetical protein
MAQVLTNEHPQWDDFCDRLARAITVPGKPDSWRCDGDANSNPTLVHRYAKQVMAEMGGIDVNATLEFFKSHGGCCDCEVLFNVDTSYSAIARL